MALVDARGDPRAAAHRAADQPPGRGALSQPLAGRDAGGVRAQGRERDERRPLRAPHRRRDRAAPHRHAGGGSDTHLVPRREPRRVRAHPSARPLHRVGHARDPGPGDSSALGRGGNRSHHQSCRSEWRLVLVSRRGLHVALVDRAAPSAPSHISLLALATGQKRSLTRPEKECGQRPREWCGDRFPTFSLEGELAFARDRADRPCLPRRPCHPSAEAPHALRGPRRLGAGLDGRRLQPRPVAEPGPGRRTLASPRRGRRAGASRPGHRRRRSMHRVTAAGPFGLRDRPVGHEPVAGEWADGDASRGPEPDRGLDARTTRCRPSRPTAARSHSRQTGRGPSRSGWRDPTARGS